MNIHRGAQGTVRLATASEHFGGDAARDHLAWRATPTDGYRNLDATTRPYGSLSYHQWHMA